MRVQHDYTIRTRNSYKFRRNSREVRERGVIMPCVPNSFGVGITIPLVKDKTGNINDVNNYRGITLSPVISKLFEVVLLSMCNDVLKTDSIWF